MTDEQFKQLMDKLDEVLRKRPDPTMYHSQRRQTRYGDYYDSCPCPDCEGIRAALMVRT